METTDAIILKIAAYSDTARIVSAYSAEKGHLSFYAPLIKGNGVNSVQTMQPVEIEYSPNERGGMHKIHSIMPTSNYSGIYTNIYKMNVAMLWGEILDKLLRVGDANKTVYQIAIQSIDFLSTCSDSITGNFNLIFLFRLSLLCGFKIDTDTYCDGFVFNIEDGIFVPPNTSGAYITGPNTAKAVYMLCHDSLESACDIPLGKKSKSSLLTVIITFYSLQLNTDFNTKSVKVLRQVFDA